MQSLEYHDAEDDVCSGCERIRASGFLARTGNNNCRSSCVGVTFDHGNCGMFFALFYFSSWVRKPWSQFVMRLIIEIPVATPPLTPLDTSLRNCDMHQNDDKHEEVDDVQWWTASGLASKIHEQI